MRPNQKAAEMTGAELTACIDQSVPKPGLTQDEIRRYIQAPLQDQGFQLHGLDK